MHGRQALTPYGIAKLAHAMNRATARIHGAPDSKDWERETEAVRRGWIFGVVFVMRTHCTAEDLHKRMSQALFLDGYKKGEAVDHSQKTHLACVPFCEMPADYKIRMELFHALVTNLKQYI